MKYKIIINDNYTVTNVIENLDLSTVDTTQKQIQKRGGLIV